MHSTDRELRNLLVEDESSTELRAIARHVETCTQCQARLDKLAGAGRWTGEVVAQWRANGYTSDSVGLDQTDELPRTIVDSQASDSDELEIETDAIHLDFLCAPAHPELLGRLGRYDIERVIGAGGMGIVLKGYDSELHRAVAIKVLASHLAHSAAARRRFAREAQATAAVIHPNVIPIHNVECEGRVPYLVMRYINGQSLQARVDQQGPLAVVDALRIAQQTAAGLAAAHAQGLIHRDVKPANILLDEGIERVVLSDFGLARTVDDASLTHTGIVTGTPHYMSPEQAGGESIDCRSDLFSLGCVLWFMLTGRPPFRAATAMGVLNRICHDTHNDIRQINASVPIPLARIIDRLLAKRPDERTASAQALEQELLEVTRAVQAGQLSLDASTDNLAAAKWSLTRVAIVGTSLLIVCLLIGGSWSQGIGNMLLLGSPSQPGSTASAAKPDPPKSDPSPLSTPGDQQRTPEQNSARPPQGAWMTPLSTSSYASTNQRSDDWYLQAELVLSALGSLETEDRETFWRLHQALRYNASLPLDQLSRELDVLSEQITLPKLKESTPSSVETTSQQQQAP